MAKSKKNARAFRLSFGGTKAKKWAPTMRQAVADARYWVGFGQKKVCIDKMLPTGSVKRIRCVTRR